MIGHLLNDALDVYRATYTADGAGGRTQAFAKVDTVRAKVGQPTAAERTVAAQVGANLTHVVHVPYASTVERGDELDTGDDRRLRVLAVIHDSHRSYKRLECEVTQGE